jgi:hypothetical protein
MPPKAIYLDLNAASEIACATTGSQWAVIRDRLQKKFEEGRIVCPLPLETLAEAAPCDMTQRVAIEKLFLSLSRGAAFRPFTNMILNATIALVRSRWPVPIYVPIRAGWSIDEKFMETTRSDADQSRSEMASRMDGATPPESADEKDVKAIFDEICKERSAMAYRDFEHFSKDGHDLKREYEIPWLIAGAARAALTRKEADLLCDAICHHKWEAIPENYFDLRLTARWEHDRIRKHRPNYFPNDEIDRWRAAVALTNCQLFVTDKYAADLCRRSGVLDIAGTTVLSVRQRDEFLAFIENA